MKRQMSPAEPTPPRSPPGPRAAPTGLRAELERHRAALDRMLAEGQDGIALGLANARFLDQLFGRLFTAARKQVGESAQPLALAAVGSFGRGAVAARSDADVVLVVGPAVQPADASAFAEALLYPLWDATLMLGHQVLSVADALPLAREDLATATALLDLRLLGGDPGPLRELVDRAHEGLFGDSDLDAFIDRLEAEAAARHERFGGSVYLLEPDVKSGAGGLRDLDGARWAARARYRVGEGGSSRNVMQAAAQAIEGPVAVWHDLVRVGVIQAREAKEIAAAEEFLWRLRNRLHVRAGRKMDRLGFEEQEALALAMGYGDDRAQAAEKMMQEYYVHARAVTRARTSLLERLRPRRRKRRAADVDLGNGVRLFDGAVTVAGSAELEAHPAVAMRVFETCVRQDAPLFPFARDAITRAAADPAWCERLRADKEVAAIFVDLVCTASESRMRRGSIAGEMHDVGLLLAMVPEFLPVTGRVHHDVYHVYTVDVHSVAALDRLRQFARGELAQEFPLATRLAAEIALPRPLYLATLLHDVGKGWPDAQGSRKNHSQTGAALCERILLRLGLSREEVDDAKQLVLDHLLMYHVSTRRDLDDAATIAEFCRSVRGLEGLRNLYLLTVADLSTTSPTAMTSWKARMLDELYFAAEAYLVGQAPREESERVERVRVAVRAAWTGRPGPIDALLTSMPERYLLANSPESIVQHARVVAERGSRAAHLARVSSRHPEAAELCVVADDRPGLLASIAAAITASRLEVLGAQVYSRQVDGRVEALDVFWVRDRDGGTSGVDEVLPRLARDVDDVCAGRVDGADLLRSRTGTASPWRERPSPAVPTEVIIDDRASPRHTVIEVFAKDRPGLLYALAKAMHELGLSIALSKINTEGTRVADVFYVSDLGDRRHLDAAKVERGRYSQIHDALVHAVES
jgi:[protein-PII] uridylyltransferase